MEPHIKLSSINVHITCKICNGYLIDATTVTECLHTFCKSCLVKHLQKKNTCPTCNIIIHQSHPLQYIRFDRTMQDIVYKVVPNLQENELQREQEFYRSRGLPNPRPQASSSSGPPEDDIEQQLVTDFHRADEQVNIELDCISSELKPLNRKFIRLSSQATITHLKKFVAKKTLGGMERHREIDILLDGQLVGKDHTLKFVYLTKWRHKAPPMLLLYKLSTEMHM